MSHYLDLLDYRRQVARIYDRVRGGTGEDAWSEWRAARDRLFATHPQSPIEDRAGFLGLDYFDYDDGWRTMAVLDPGDRSERSVANSGEGATSFTSIGTLHLSVKGNDAALEVLWLNSYGGGLFIPFRDATNGRATYGGGRYLLDTVKGADLGHSGDEIVVDFNYSYHPSCVYSSRWSCPLAPLENKLPFVVEAGEKLSEQV